MSNPVPPLEVRSRLGKFLLLEVLGEGGMGMVWLAEDTSLGRNVALKVIRPEYAFRDDIRARFIQEARAAAQVEHERIVRIFEVGEDRKVPFIAMELLKGRDLYKYLQAEPVPPLSFTLKVIAQVLQGLSAAHTHPNRLIHRDIKPQNIWLESGEERTKIRCKILDFGIAKSSAEDRLKTHTGVFIGTIDYASPEQLNAEELDPRSDLFSVGVMLYQMLTGVMPYKERGLVSRGDEMLTKTPRSPVEANPKLPRSLADFTLRLMAVNRDHRPSSAREAIQLLDAIIKNPKGAQGNSPPLVPPSQTNIQIVPKPEPPPRFVPPSQTNIQIVPKEEPPPLPPLPVPTGNIEWEDLTPQVEPPPPPMPKRFRDDTLPPLDQRTEVPPARSKRNAIVAVMVVALLFVAVILAAMSGGGPKGGSSSGSPRKTKSELNEIAGEKKDSSPEKEPAHLDCTVPGGASEATVKDAQQKWAAFLGVLVETSVVLDGGVEMKFVLVPPGKFMMGAPESEKESQDDEYPLHEVTLTKPFYIGKYEVTQQEYAQLTDQANPSHFKKETTSPRHPVENVSWNEAKAAGERMPKSRLPKGFTKVSLPTEAQWEYACRAGTRTPFHFGEVLNGDRANCNGNVPYGTSTKGRYLEKTCPVDSKDCVSNALGLHQMHGNVWEWCLDGYDASAYKASGRTDPFTDHSNNNRRPLRGGSWLFGSRYCRASNRDNNSPEFRDFNFGFRLSLQP